MLETASAGNLRALRGQANPYVYSHLLDVHLRDGDLQIFSRDSLALQPTNRMYAQHGASS